MNKLSGNECILVADAIIVSHSLWASIIMCKDFRVQKKRQFTMSIDKLWDGVRLEANSKYLYYLVRFMTSHEKLIGKVVFR